MLNLDGVYTALITPFKNDEQINWSSLENLIEFQIKNSVSGLIALGTTAETPCLDDSEKHELLKFIIQKVAGRIPVIAGTGSNNTKKTIQDSLAAKELGADGILVVTPYYNKPTQEGVFQHFAAVNQACDLPLVVYNIPGRSVVNITTPTLMRIAKLNNVIGVKESSGSIDQMMEVIKQKDSNQLANFKVASGDDALTFPLMACGGCGVISVASNLIPAQVKQLTDLCSAGKFLEARKLHFSLLEIFKQIFIETNPAPIKFLLNLEKFNVGGCRLPLVNLQKESVEKLENLWKNFNGR